MTDICLASRFLLKGQPKEVLEWAPIEETLCVGDGVETSSSSCIHVQPTTVLYICDVRCGFFDAELLIGITREELITCKLYVC